MFVEKRSVNFVECITYLLNSVLFSLLGNFEWYVDGSAIARADCGEIHLTLFNQAYLVVNVLVMPRVQRACHLLPEFLLAGRLEVSGQVEDIHGWGPEVLGILLELDCLIDESFSLWNSLEKFWLRFFYEAVPFWYNAFDRSRILILLEDRVVEVLSHIVRQISMLRHEGPPLLLFELLSYRFSLQALLETSLTSLFVGHFHLIYHLLADPVLNEVDEVVSSE